MNFLNNRPFCVMGILSGLHTLLYGLGFVFAFQGFSETRLYDAIANFPLVTPDAFGIVAIIVGLLTIVAFVKEHKKAVGAVSYFNALVWLFAAITYYQQGEFVLGTTIAIIWTFFSWYVGYVFVNRDRFIRGLIRDNT